MTQESDIERINRICEFIQSKIKFKPTIGIVCGSGASLVAQILENPISIRYSDIPSFPVSSVAGHQGNLVFGQLHGKNLVLMQGRIHLYEGVDLKDVTLPIRVMKYLGIEALFLTNAAGSVQKNIKCGDFCILKDHINLPSLAGKNPLIGPNIDEYGPRFPSLTGAYDRELRKLGRQVALKLNLNDRVHDAIYFCQGGPSYETPAELTFIRNVGCDLIGMSTAHEVITARHMGIRVFCLSLVSNECILDVDEEREPNHEEVLETARDRSQSMKEFLTEMVAQYKSISV